MDFRLQLLHKYVEFMQQLLTSIAFFMSSPVNMFKKYFE
jgi:hypothetical protein